MGDYYWFDGVKKIIDSVTKGYCDTKLPLVDPYLVPETRINNMYPYTFEQTVRVTHYNKPKRRDPARRWNNV
jgi:hypothetical protein